MNNLMTLRYRTAITVCLISILSTGCATTYQEVDAALLEQNKSKTFKLGIVKAAGNPLVGLFGSSYIDEKKKALDNVPIAEICSILSNKYSITIDTNVDKTVKVVTEAMRSGPPTGGNQPGVFITLNRPIENAYYGNLVYENASTLGLVFGSSSQIINKKEFPDVVNVTYSLDPGFKQTFFYDINIISSEQVILKMHGIVGSIEPDSIGFNYDSYVDYAGRISEALKKDLFETANK
ncbi:MAG: hypothetical protein AABZ15_10530 [Nitrospirota bacterium]